MEGKYKNVGRRKRSVAQVKIISGTGAISINSKTLSEYVQSNSMIMKLIMSPLLSLELENKYDLIIKVMGGGIIGQAEAIKLAISRVIYELVNKESGHKLKYDGFLSRDCRRKERKKYGLKKARKAPQFSKR